MPNSCELLSLEPKELGALCLNLFRSARRTPQNSEILHTLLESGALLRLLCNRDALSLQQAVELIQSTFLVDRVTDAKLLRNVVHQSSRFDAAGPAAANELLAVFDAAGLGARLQTLLVQLLRTRDPKVRSKAALLLLRQSGQASWALEDPDPRVRANAVQALWEIHTPSAREICQQALEDPHHRVVGNAIVALLRAGDPAAAAHLERIARHESARFRAAAAWAAGIVADPNFEPLLRKLAADPDSVVRRRAQESLAATTAPP
ncbi:MAG: HEAT repeat domain-containing protein [Acidobacteria bacterium]|nr:HEAT repeat domain-containing protein [Acidobacteriota bacterium]